VLQKEGIIFQFDSTVTAISYLSRAVTIENREIKYRKIKDSILLNTKGIISNPDGINIATKERAFLDLLYLNGEMYFDTLNTLNIQFVYELLTIYESKALQIRVEKLLKK